MAVSLAALLVFPRYFLRSFAYAGIAMVVLAAVASVVSLPALLAVLGTKVDALRLPLRRRNHGVAKSEGAGLWHQIATWVMSVVPTVEPASLEGEALVHRLRDLEEPFPGPCRRLFMVWRKL